MYVLKKAERRLDFILFIPFHNFLFKKTVQRREEEFQGCTTSLREAKHQLSECKVIIEVQFDSALAPFYDTAKYAFEKLQTSQYCWDVTASVQVDRVKERSYAGTSILRKPVSVKQSSLGFVSSEHSAFHFVNANGADLYLFPAFLIAFGSATDFALVEYRDLSIKLSNVRFVEEDSIPKDTAIIDKTWKYVNKNGSQDRRFSNNYEIPIVLYGEIHFTSSQGLNEAYQFSNAESTREFVESVLKYQTAISKLQSAG